MGVQRIESDATLIRPSDIVYQDELVTSFISSFFVGKNTGHAIVVPNKHFENIYDIQKKYAHRVFDIAQKVALAMGKAYECDGITTRQNNEPAGDQHALHYHLHIFPRYADDGFNTVRPSEKRLAEPAERALYARRLSLTMRG